MSVYMYAFSGFNTRYLSSDAFVHYIFIALMYGTTTNSPELECTLVLLLMTK